MAASIESLTPEVIRQVARLSAAYGVPREISDNDQNSILGGGSSSYRADSEQESSATPRSSHDSACFPPERAYVPRGNMRFMEDPRWLEHLTVEEAPPRGRHPAGESPEVEPPPLVRAAWLNEGGACPLSQTRSLSPAPAAFSGRGASASSRSMPASPEASRRNFQSETSEGTTQARSPRYLSPENSEGTAHARSPRYYQSETSEGTAHARSPRHLSPENSEGNAHTRSPRYYHSETSEGTNFAEFTLSEGMMQGITFPDGSVTPRQAGPPSEASSKAISVDELVGRLYKAGEQYNRRRIEKQEAARLAEEDVVQQPKINRKSIRLASGMEPLELRKDKILQKKEDMIAVAQKKMEDKINRENTGKPVISAQAQRMYRSLHTLTRWEEQRNLKLAQRQHLKMKGELRECTFKPELCPGTKMLTAVSHCNENIFASDHLGGVHDRLNNDAHRRKNKAAAEAEKLAPQPHQRDKVADLGRRTNCWPANETSIMSTSSIRSKISNGSSHKGSPTTSTGSRTPGKSGSGGTPRSTPRRVPEPPQPAIAAKQMSFDEFMRTLAAERAGAQKPPHYDSGVSAAEARSRAAEVLPFAEFSKRAGLGRVAKVSDAEDELLLAEAPREAPQATPPPRVRSLSPSPTYPTFAQDSSDASLPEWVRRVRPEPAAPRGAACASAGRPAVQRSHSARGIVSTSQPPKEHSENVIMYTGRFDDVFRAGYGGALPGTQDAQYGSQP